MAQTSETLVTVCKICGSVHRKPFRSGLCRHLCQEVFPGVLSWNGLRQMMVFHKFDGVYLMLDWPKGDVSGMAPSATLAYANSIKLKYLQAKRLQTGVSAPVGGILNVEASK